MRLGFGVHGGRRRVRGAEGAWYRVHQVKEAGRQGTGHHEDQGSGHRASPGSGFRAQGITRSGFRAQGVTWIRVRGTLMSYRVHC